jgi:hypothetical protein
LNLLKTSRQLNGANKGISEDRVTESIHTPEVPNGITFSLDTTFLKCQASTGAKLKEFYHSMNHCDERLMHCNHEVPTTVTGFCNTDKSS